MKIVFWRVKTYYGFFEKQSNTGKNSEICSKLNLPEIWYGHIYKVIIFFFREKNWFESYTTTIIIKMVILISLIICQFLYPILGTSSNLTCLSNQWVSILIKLHQEFSHPLKRGHVFVLIFKNVTPLRGWFNSFTTLII